MTATQRFKGRNAVEQQRISGGGTAQLAADLVKAERRMQDQVLKAPIDGTVQQLAVHTVGGVVTPAQSLLVVVPAEASIEIEAMVPNRDIGFVHDGDQAEIGRRGGMRRGEVARERQQLEQVTTE